MPGGQLITDYLGTSAGTPSGAPSLAAGTQTATKADTVNGILRFMQRKGIISVGMRELNAVGSVPVGSPATATGLAQP